MQHYQSIDEYIQKQSKEMQPKLKQMRELIHSEAPEATEKISYDMPTFFLNHNLVHFAAGKNHIGFYPTPSGVSQFADRLTDYKTSKGAIQFPMDQELPEELIREIVRFRVLEETK